MNNKHAPSSKETKRAAISRLFSEKTLLMFFAGASLAFGLFYTFVHNTAQAQSADLAAAPAVSAVEQTVAVNGAVTTPAAPSTAADVVTKALAFKASLTTAQQAIAGENLHARAGSQMVESAVRRVVP